MKILQINSSVQGIDKSVTRQLSNDLVSKLGGDVTVRELTEGVPFVTGAMVGSFYTPDDKRTDEQKELIKVSDELIAEIKAADVLVLGAPLYNFSVPGSVKAYFDLVARPGVTFKYTENGPVGLLEGKKAYIILASGGTEIGGDQDYASNYAKHFLGFIGIKDVEFIAANQLMFDAEGALAKAKAKVDELVAIGA